MLPGTRTPQSSSPRESKVLSAVVEIERIGIVVPK